MRWSSVIDQILVSYKEVKEILFSMEFYTKKSRTDFETNFYSHGCHDNLSLLTALHAEWRTADEFIHS